MDCRTVLTVNHVFEMLLSVRNGNNWKDAILEVLPKNKHQGLRENHRTPEENSPPVEKESENDSENEF